MTTVEDAVSSYLKLRNRKGALKAAYEAAAGELEAKMQKFEGWFITKAQEQGVTSFKTKAGTAFLTNTDFANVADWDAALAFIKENDTYDMLERRISKRAVRAYIDEFGTVPAGITFGSRLDVNVRKPAGKGGDNDTEVG
jgi:hypothetical protein